VHHFDFRVSPNDASEGSRVANKTKWTGLIGNPGAPRYTGPTLVGEPDPVWQAKHKAHLEEVAREAAKRREGLQKSYEYVVKYVHDALESSSLDQEEKELLSKGQAKLKDVLRLLDSLLEETSSAVRRNDICYVMAGAIWSVFVVTSYWPPARAIRRREQILRIESGRASKKISDTERAEKLRKAILAVAKDLKASSKYAGSIRTQVRNHLGITSGTWPSIRTIERGISAILKECRES
jgi:hypothetical protein